MKYTNKDGKLRLYDATVGTYTDYVSDFVLHTTVTQIGDSGASWTTNEFVGHTVEIISGEALGERATVISNSSNLIYLNRLVSGVVSGDSFRVYDVVLPPWYIELCLDNGDLSAPIGVPNRERTLILSRGAFTTCSHYVTGNDVSIMEPLDITFSVMINDSQKFQNLLDWLDGADVNGNTTVTTKGYHERLHIADGTLPFRDPTKKAFNLEYFLNGPNTPICYTWYEVYFDPGSWQMGEAEDGVNLTITGRWYGDFATTSQFTTGNDIEA